MDISSSNQIWVLNTFGWKNWEVLNTVVDSLKVLNKCVRVLHKLGESLKCLKESWTRLNSFGSTDIESWTSKEFNEYFHILSGVADQYFCDTLRV